jgi:phospholipase/carboxylesterase
MAATIETSENNLNTDLGLSYLIKPAPITTGKQKALILLHGVGSNEQDLFSLAKYLPANYTVISPRGPFVLGEGRFAWYQVDFSSGKPEINADQEAQSRETIREFIVQVKEKYNLDEVYLGGFSQGAIMSYTIGLTQPSLITGVLAFSGRILQEIRPMVAEPASLKDLRVLIAHGTQDGTLPVHYAREAKTYLEDLGIKPGYHEFNGGHQITGEVLTAVSDWLKL